MQVKPKSVTINGKKIAEQNNRVAEGWYWEKLSTGGVLSIHHTTGNNIAIVK